jgi:hypothetical protein
VVPPDEVHLVLIHHLGQRHLVGHQHAVGAPVSYVPQLHDHVLARGIQLWRQLQRAGGLLHAMVMTMYVAQHGTEACQPITEEKG